MEIEGSGVSFFGGETSFLGASADHPQPAIVALPSSSSLLLAYSDAVATTAMNGDLMHQEGAAIASIPAAMGGPGTIGGDDHSEKSAQRLQLEETTQRMEEYRAWLVDYLASQVGLGCGCGCYYITWQRQGLTRVLCVHASAT